MNKIIVEFTIGFVIGAACIWCVQERRFDALQSRFDGFVQTVKAEGEAAQKLADAKAKEDQQIKDAADHEYKTNLSALLADNKRLRNARSSSHIVPSAPSGSRSPNLACFDRAELEQALQRFDAGTSGLVDEGDKNTLALSVAKDWIAKIEK